MRALVWRAWPALLAWAAAATMLLATAAAFGAAPFAARTWARWDSGLYFQIARHGYTLFPCATEPGDWCGNAAWFPLYPWLLRALDLVGLPLAPAAVVLAWLLAGATLVVLWVFFLDRRLSPVSIAAIAYAAFAPGQVFDYAAYPLSLLALATAAHLALMVRGRWLLAGLAGLAAALTYPLGLLVAVSSGVWLLADRRASWQERVRRVAIVSGLTACGGAIVVLVQRAQTGSWEAFFLVQAKYAHSWHSPVTSLRTDLFDVRTARPILQLSTVPPLQSLFLGLVVGCVVLAIVLRRPRLQRNDVLVALWAVATWALPQSETGISRYRSEAALLPLAVLLPRLPRRLAIVLAVAAVAIAVPMADLFLKGQLR